MKIIDIENHHLAELAKNIYTILEQANKLNISFKSFKNQISYGRKMNPSKEYDHIWSTIVANEKKLSEYNWIIKFETLMQKDYPDKKSSFFEVSLISRYDEIKLYVYDEKAHDAADIVNKIYDMLRNNNQFDKHVQEMSKFQNDCPQYEVDYANAINPLKIFGNSLTDQIIDL